MNQYVRNLRPRQQSAIPNVIFALLIINGLLFALQQFYDRELLVYFGLWPLVDGSPFGPWQLLTYGFLHDTRTLTHIVFNMFMLWMWGRELEIIMGSQRFLIYYLTCVIGAGIVQLVVAKVVGPPYRPTIGASGGVFGLLLAFGLTFPNRMIMLIFPPIPMRAKYMVIIFGALELFLGVSGAAPGVANFAHLGGMVFGFLLLNYWSRPRRRQ